ncbi:cobalamin-binding protein [Pseudohongiella sp.]|uniref:Fe/B12 periplasmic-binding domain-containing protein n=1 Tax=marine sediment metagenome TaxID=412755 RepID=A0A0F9YJK1_9ZZZZ|nr:cobalamin-binding protein [Pseudohongiella sp.]
MLRGHARCASVMATILLAVLPLTGTSDSDLGVFDDDGTRIVLPAPAKRIISLAPSMTELLFSLGAGDQLVGVMDYSDYPPEALSLPVVGRYDSLDMERIVALQPDLIVAWRSGNPRGALNRLATLGFPVYVAEPDSLASIGDHLQRLGILTGHAAEGAQLNRQFSRQIEQLRADFGDKEPVRVFYQVWHSPMISVGGNELINDMINLCGGGNIFAELPVGPKVNLEDVLARNPQVIIASGSSAQAPAWLDEWLRWPQLAAVGNQHLYVIPPDQVQRHSLRALQGARQMCGHIDQARR